MSNGCCSRASLELKLYQAFIFCVPIFFTLILLFLFYLFYLRRRRHHWPSLRTRDISFSLHSHESDETSRAELGLKKELRELLPIIVFRESFSVKDPQCSVCLGDYQAEERLQQIPACGHTFHLNCIDSWLANHSTCPLCRQSLLVSVTASTQLPAIQSETDEDRSFDPPPNVEETPVENVSHQQCNGLNQQHQHDESHDMNDVTNNTPCNNEGEVHRPDVSIKINDDRQGLPSLDVRLNQCSKELKADSCSG